MKHPLKRALLFIALLLGTMLPLAAQSIHLVFTLNNGEEMTFTLVEDDYVYFEDNTKLAIVQNAYANKGITRIPLADIRKIECSETEGTNENPEMALGIYPNPVHDVLMLRNVEGDQTLCIYALDGRLMKTFKTSDHQAFDVSDLPEGIYFVKTESQTLKMIKL